jgi:hypothetical protein
VGDGVVQEESDRHYAFQIDSEPLKAFERKGKAVSGRDCTVLLAAQSRSVVVFLIVHAEDDILVT